MANPVAFGQLSRAVPDDSDNPDPNRSFPGPGRRFTWLAEQLATVLATEVFPASTFVLDFHLGIWGSALGSTIVGTDYSDPQVARQSRDLSLAFGVPLIFASQVVAGFPGPRSSLGYIGEVARVPMCGSMLGGAGFDHRLEEQWDTANLRGIRNVMQYARMLGGSLELPARYLRYSLVHRVNPRNGGLLVPERPVEEFGREVADGERLGRVVSPYSLDVIEELLAPCDGYLAYWARSYPLRPGDWAYGVVPRDHAATEWVTPQELGDSR